MRKKLRVIVVHDNSQAERLGIKPGDIIKSYNGLSVSTIDEFSKAISSAKEDGIEVSKIEILRDGSVLTFNVSGDRLGMHYEEVDENSVQGRTEYKVARELSHFISFIGWCFVVFGVAGFVIALLGNVESKYIDFLSLIYFGISMVVSGFLIILGSQVTRATLDTADHAREIKEIIKNLQN